MKTPAISVILCAHNPRPDHLSRTLEALREQTLATSDWELLIVDNASSRPLVQSWDVAWHPLAQHVREERLGLIWARLSGVSHARGELLVFVDDDNVLAADYLAQTLVIAEQFPFLAAWGGQILPEFEAAPPEWMARYVGWLALFRCHRDVWSNTGESLARPWGAGLCVRRAIGERYRDSLAERGGVRASLGRRGDALMSCEDVDLVLTAVDAGYGTGRFTALRVTHLISKERVTERYLLRLAEGNAYSMAVLASLRPRTRNEFGYDATPSAREFLGRILRRLPLPTRLRRFYLAARRGSSAARKALAGA